MTLDHLIVRQVRRRPGRALLTLLGIVLGVGSMVAISLTSDTTRQAYKDMFDALTGRASLEIVADGLGGFSPEILDSVRGCPGIAAAVPLVQRPVALLLDGGIVAALALGVDPAVDRQARDYSLRAGQFLDEADGVLLEASFAASRALAVGQSIKLASETGITALPIVGLLDPKGVAGSGLGAVAVLPLARAQKLFGLEGKINTVQVVVGPNSSDKEVEAELARLLPPGLALQAPIARGAMAQETMRSTEHGLSAMSVVSLVAGAFVILNTFRMNLGERRRQLAILRSIGATRRQIIRLVLREATLLGIVGTVIGLGLGIVLALVMMRSVGPLVGVKATTLVLTLRPFVIGAVLGPGISLAAAYYPARQASKRPPLAELLGVASQRAETRRLWPAALGLALMAINLAVLVGFFRGLLPSQYMNAFIPPAMTVFLISWVLIMPALLAPIGALVDRLLAPLGGIEGRLALRRMNRQPNRTAVTVGVLTIAIVVTIGMGTTMLNNMRDIVDWRDRVIASDYYVRGAMPNVGTLASPSMPAEIGPRLEALPGVASVEYLSFVPSRIGGDRFLILARTMADGHPLNLDIEDADPQAVRARLQAGEVAVGSVLARRLGIAAGATVTLPTKQGPVPLRVAARVTDYTVGGMVMYMDWPVARRLLDFKGVDAFCITVPDGQAAAADEALRAFCQRETLFLQPNAELRAVIDELVEGIVGFLWLLMAMAFLVASLGIVNTLTMNVLEQTRELGVLRAIAMTRRQVRKMVFCQAVSLGVLSLVPGLLGGLGLAYLVHLSNTAVLGNPVAFSLRLDLMAGSAVIALLTAALASLVPARRAAYLNVPAALQYE